MSDAARRLRWPTIEQEAEGRLPGTAPAEVVTHPEFAGIEFLHVRAKSLINHVPAAAGMPFEHTINVYRGCSHACSYCFARPSHTYLELDAGRDFESKIVVKINAVERLRAELRRPSWGGHHIAMGTNTDPYQRCEGRYRLTRGVIETLTQAGNPFSVLTKSPLVLRELDLLAEANRRMHVPVSLSIPTLDEQVWRTSEPGTPHPRRRLEAVAALSEAGVPSGVMVAPVLPGISDSYRQLEEVVAGALEAGATSVTPVTLHLRPGVREVFMGWLAETHPRLVPTYERLYQRAYAPPEVRRRISRRVHHLVERHGGPRPHAERERSGWRADAPPTGVAGAADPDRGQQLSLGL